MSWQPYAVTTGALAVAAVVGTRATDIGPWYRELNKPSWQPPEWSFGVIWTTIYVLIIVSVGLGWNAAPASAQAGIALAVGVNLVVNTLWSVLFFKLRRPSWSLVEVVALWLSVVWMIAVIHPHHALAAWLLAPYLVWVSVAACLNLTIVRLNPGEV